MKEKMLKSVYRSNKAHHQALLPLLVCSFVVLFVFYDVSEAKQFRVPRLPLPRYRDASNDSVIPPYTVSWFNQTLDHFNFENAQVWSQRYLSTDIYYQAGGPILFYTGNEGSIDLFWNNTGFAFVLAQQLNAFVLFAEHRYYGESLPFGPASFEKDNIGFLSVEQALADYANIINQFKSAYGNSVVSIGGSYGGMLSAWLRMKYPDSVDAALAASAPILQFQGTSASPSAFNEIITVDFEDAAPSCSNIVQEAYGKILSISQQQNGLESLQETFRVCGELTNVDDLINWLESGMSYEAMADYPYPANFLEPMPGNPINLTCAAIVQGDDILQSLVNGMAVYYNSSGQEAQCFNMSVYSTSALGMDAWDYQACTELVLVVASNNVTDMFPPSPFNFSALSEYCQEAWGVVPNLDWATTYGYASLSGASNIIFSNGVLDPWRGGGVQETTNDSLPAIIIEGGAHHLDIRNPNPLDPQSVIAARDLEINYITKWLQNAN